MNVPTALITIPAATSTKVQDLAHKVDRLSPDRHDPERFHMDRSEIVDDLRQLARTMEAAPRTC